MNFNEINPGVAKLVAMLQAHGFMVTDSDDGVTGVELGLKDTLDFPHVFMAAPADQVIAESHRLYDLLRDKACFDLMVDRGPDQPLSLIEASYSPVSWFAVLDLSNLNDTFVFGPDADLDKKRLGYQIRFCDAWLDDPSSPREYTYAAERDTKRAFYHELRETLAKRLANLNFDPPPI